MDKIIIEDIRVEGRHGCADTEQTYLQPFRVDVTVGGDFSRAAAVDRVEATVDYRLIVEVAKEVVTGPSVYLLETLAERIAGKIRRIEGVQNVRVRVTKLRPPIPEFHGTTAVEIER